MEKLNKTNLSNDIETKTPSKRNKSTAWLAFLFYGSLMVTLVERLARNSPKLLCQ